MEAMTNVHVHRSRVDAWVWLALAVPILAPAAAIVAAHGHGPAVPAAAVALATVLAVFGGLVFPMRYTVSAAGIEVRYGVVRQVIAWAQIDAIRLSSNLLSAPALSRQRLEITYREANGGGATQRISPVERFTFLRDCEKAAPALRSVDGPGDGVLVRQP